MSASISRSVSTVSAATATRARRYESEGIQLQDADALQALHHHLHGAVLPAHHPKDARHGAGLVHLARDGFFDALVL